MLYQTNEASITNSPTIQSLQNESIVVVCAADNGYAMPLAVTVRSAIENLQEGVKLNLFIIDGGIKEENKTKIRDSLPIEKCEIKWIDNPDVMLGRIEVLRDPSFGDFPEPKHIRIPAYYRLLIPKLLPPNITKAIYLDSDLIIARDLSELWNTPIDEYYLLAVQDMNCPYISSPPGLVNYRELGIPVDAKYFTSGVLVLNLEKWRADHISDRCVEYLQTHREYIRWHDTDVLNAVLACKWGELDPRWNQMAHIFGFSSWQDTPFSQEVFEDLRNHPYIVHFATSAKPWNSRRHHPFKHLFFHYLDMTVWSGWRFTTWKWVWQKLLREAKNLTKRISIAKPR